MVGIIGGGAGGSSEEVLVNDARGRELEHEHKVVETIAKEEG